MMAHFYFSFPVELNLFVIRILASSVLPVLIKNDLLKFKT